MRTSVLCPEPMWKRAGVVICTSDPSTWEVKEVPLGARNALSDIQTRENLGTGMGNWSLLLPSHFLFLLLPLHPTPHCNMELQRLAFSPNLHPLPSGVAAAAGRSRLTPTGAHFLCGTSLQRCPWRMTPMLFIEYKLSRRVSGKFSGKLVPAPPTLKTRPK